MLFPEYTANNEIKAPQTYTAPYRELMSYYRRAR